MEMEIICDYSTKNIPEYPEKSKGWISMNHVWIIKKRTIITLKWDSDPKCDIFVEKP